MYIHAKVSTGAREESFVFLNETHVAISVREPAKRNQANERIIELLRMYIPGATRVRLVSGHHAPTKLFAVDTVDIDK